MTSSEIRASFLDFFREKGHTIVPSGSLLPDQPDIPFTNAGMNQFVPIFLGQTPCPYQPPRAADTQKCIRASGKHNDLEDVGFDTYHHTFFEMLGNWSFGDYFKKEAIAWAWELVVERWKFPASRLYATVYCPHMDSKLWFQELKALEQNIDVAEVIKGDQFRPMFLNNNAEAAGITFEHSDIEAVQHWYRLFRKAKLDPYIHIVPGNKKDNFWMMGDTGPCGPCSELHVDLTPGPRDLPEDRQRAGRDLVNKGDARCIEIWNLVFIQFNAVVLKWEDKEIHQGIFKQVPAETRFDALPKRHVDTGMGFERVTSMIQGTKGLTDFSAKVKISNYETDIFRPLFDELEKITGKKYASTLPASPQNLSEQEKMDVAFRVIADHVRTLSFSIADGISPSNEGRGYVLRRILRRAVRYGSNLGLREPFLGKLVDVLGATMGAVFPEIVQRADAIKKTLRQEEESFLRTLDEGIWEFEHQVSSYLEIREGSDVAAGEKPSSVTVLPGSIAFGLYDTYGLPLDLTELMARERGMSVDVAEFDRLMAEQKAKGKAAQKKEVITVEDSGQLDQLRPTVFYGYDELQTPSHVVANEKGALAVSETPFYAEMGGQVGDTGEIQYSGQTFAVTNTVRSGPVIFHKLAAPMPADVGETVILRVDAYRRGKIEAHHSGTHLLHWALRKVLGDTVTQRGSYVGPDRLRFDFSHGTAVTSEELAEIEKLINEKIEANVPVIWEERPYAEVKGDSSILQFFGDKYGETVRVVSIGSFSRELCGGTHVRHSGNIGFFKILSEGAIAAGIRRIEAVSGAALMHHVEEEFPKQDAQYSALRRRKVDLASLRSYIGDPVPHLLWYHWESRQKTLQQALAEVAQHEKDEAKRQEATFQKRAATEIADLIASAKTLNGIPFLTRSIDDVSAAYLPVLADAIKSRWPGVAVLAAVDQGKVALLCSVAPAFSKKVQAGKIIQALAPLVGGKGGGRPELAQGGGMNPDGLPAALAKAEEMVSAS